MIKYCLLIIILLYTNNIKKLQATNECGNVNSPSIYMGTDTVPMITLICCLYGNNFVEWRKNNKTIIQNTENYVIQETDYAELVLSHNQIQSAGTYSCVLNSTDGTTTILYVALTKYASVMEYKPEQYLMLTKDGTIYLGSSNILAMKVEWNKKGMSKPLIKYDPAGSKKPSTGRYLIDGYGNLLIKNIYANDSGIYIAYIKDRNNEVKETKQFELYVGTAPFRAIYPKNNYYFTIGDVGVIECSTYGVGLNNYWLYKSQSSNEQKRITRDSLNKYQLDIDGTLTINNINSNDIGTYTCISENLFGIISSTTKIIGVIKPAKIIRLNNGYGRVGSRVTISCVVEGNPPPKITWWRNNRQISNYRNIKWNISELYFDYMIQGDAGLYTCVADNNATIKGKRAYDLKDVELYNEEKPFINANLSSKIEFVTKYTSVANIRCVSENLPFSRLYLTYNNKEVKGEGISINKDMNQLVLDYVFSFTDDQQLGIYTCIAQNTYGYDTLNILVTLISEPNPPTNIRVSSIDVTSAIISWEFPEVFLISRYHDFQVLVFTKQKFKYFTAVTKQNSILLEGLVRDTTYYVQLRSHIISGWSVPTTVSFKTLKIGAPHPPNILNSQLFLNGIDIHLIWEYPTRNFNDSNYVFTVSWCRLDYFNITNLHSHCNLVSDLYSTEFMITGLVADNFYSISVGAKNYYGNRHSRDFMIIAGKNPYIGARTSKLDSIFISLIVILAMLLIILLIDLIMLFLYSYGVIYFIYTVIFAKWPKECICDSKYTKFESTHVTETKYKKINTNIEEKPLESHEVFLTHNEIQPANEYHSNNIHVPLVYEYADEIPYTYEDDNNRIKFVSFSKHTSRSYRASLRRPPRDIH